MTTSNSSTMQERQNEIRKNLQKGDYIAISFSGGVHRARIERNMGEKATVIVDGFNSLEEVKLSDALPLFSSKGENWISYEYDENSGKSGKGQS